MTNIVRGDQTFSGVAEIGGKIVCAGCKKQKVKITALSHIDADKWFQWTYECNCGNLITITTMRKGEDLAMWAASEEPHPNKQEG